MTRVADRCTGKRSYVSLTPHSVFLVCLHVVLVCYAAVWLMNIADLNIYDIIAFTGYKFIGYGLTPAVYYEQLVPCRVGFIF